MTRIERLRPADESQLQRTKTEAGDSAASLPPTVSENPNLGALGGRAGYQEKNRRVKGFTGKVIETESDYIAHLERDVLPVVQENPGTSRVIDRLIVRSGLTLPMVDAPIQLDTEAIVPLGDEWKGYNWVMAGTNFEGRQISDTTRQALIKLAHTAAHEHYEPPRQLPAGFSIEMVKGQTLPAQDLEDLVAIFAASFKTYISDLSTPQLIHEWMSDATAFPVVARNAEGRIVVVANGDLGEISVEGKPFRFLEIGDSAANPEYRGLGINRTIKHFIISQAVSMGYHSVHTETRAAWGSPNFGNAKNGMLYRGTLFSNCVITGEEDVPESSDPNLADWAREYGSLNIWAVTPADLIWQQYAQEY